MVTGGSSGTTTSVAASTELYNPATGTWIGAGFMSEKRQFHTATLLPGGKVLASGGGGDTVGSAATACDLYDPASNSWSITGAPGAALVSRRLSVGAKANGSARPTRLIVLDQARRS